MGEKRYASRSVMTAELQYLQIARATWDSATSNSFTRGWGEQGWHKEWPQHGRAGVLLRLARTSLASWHGRSEDILTSASKY